MKRSLLSLLLLASCSRPVPPLPTYNTVPDFTLTSEQGREFGSKDLAGKIWIADFIFTTCTGPCPRMSTQMRRVQEAVKDQPNLALVSFTVDPAKDTPAALAEYARRYKADPDRWHFLTGPRETLHILKLEAFKLGSVDGSLNHSTRFVLIDAKRRVRAYYLTTEDDYLTPLLRDIRRLREERS